MDPARTDLLSTLSRVASGLAALRGINDARPLSEGGFELQFDEWDWEIGVGVYGLFRHAEASGDAGLMAALARWYDWRIARGLPPRQVNSSAPMLALAGLIDHVDRPDWVALVQDWADWLVTGLPRTEDVGFQHVVKERLNEGELWDDTLFMTCLFLARAGRRFGWQDWIDEAVYQFLVHARYLSDPKSGLWYHGSTFDGRHNFRHNFAGAFWGRGNAWVTIAIPELLSIVPGIDPAARRHLVSLLETQVAAFARLQRPDGFFHTLIDDPASPIEASATAGIAYGVLRGIDLGLLPGTYRNVAERGQEAVLCCITDSGIVSHVSDGTPMGHTPDFYRRIPDIPAPYGQALTMMLLVEALAQAPA